MEMEYQGDRASIVVRDKRRLEKWPEPDEEGLCAVLLWILDFNLKALLTATAGF